MVDVGLPYGKTDVCVRVSAINLLGSIEPKERPSAPDAKAEVLYYDYSPPYLSVETSPFAMILQKDYAVFPSACSVGNELV